jgi:hypothetical protein
LFLFLLLAALEAYCVPTSICFVPAHICIQRFFPSEFGLDVDRTGIVEPGKSILSGKVGIRRATEAAGIPYTYAVAGYFAGYGLPNIGQLLAPGPPTDKAVVLGDGDTKVVFVDEADIGTYTVLAADDPRADNKTLYIKPPANTLSHNELLSLWETKTGKTFRREYVPEEAVLKQIQGWFGSSVDDPLQYCTGFNGVLHACVCRVADPAEHHPGDRARRVRAWGAGRLRDRPGQGGGRQRAVPGCQVYHRR